MKEYIGFISTEMADVSDAGRSIQEYLYPLLKSLGGLALAMCTLFLIIGGIYYMTSTGIPSRLEEAKKIIKNALIGLVIVIAASGLTSILAGAYRQSNNTAVQQMPSLSSVQPTSTSPGLVDVLIKAITGLFQHIIESAAKPFISALDYFTKATPLMAVNGSVLNLWLVILVIANALFVLVIVLLGLHVMSFSALGLEEIELKHMIPQLALIFLAMNTSLFIIDSVIGISNALITALYKVFPADSVWKALSEVTSLSSGMGLVSLLIMVAFMVLAVILMIYYVTRLVTLYIGAVLSPLIFLLWLLPGFKDFVNTAIKTYLVTVFVLFVHVVILLLAASIFGGMVVGSVDKSLNPLMATIVGCATLISLLKTQGLMSQLSYVSMGPKAMRKLGSQFMNSVSYMTSKAQVATKAVTK
jgi:hypothetical protein